MADTGGFWRFEHLSDAQLLASLGSVLRSQRRSLAELVAHLGEVEDRRLHLEAAHGSMFSYCVARLGMSEDEACRRIELARLVRTFPALFAELETGRITLSVALVLKPILSASNHLELLAAARGKSIRQARELVAERFPKEDTPSSMRKLPERRPSAASQVQEAGSPAPSSALSAPSSEVSAPSPSLFTRHLANCSSAASASMSAGSMPAASMPAGSMSAASMSAASMSAGSMSAALSPSLPVPVPILPELSGLSSPALQRQRHSAPRPHSAPRHSRNVIEPLSAQRYRIQFTADAALKRQLELARDLLRHAHPSGELGPIVSRALTLLIDDLRRSRFGACVRRTSPSPTAQSPASTPTPAAARTTRSRSENPVSPSGSTCAQRSLTTVEPAASSSRSAHVPRAARRAVLERDGLGCSWLDADGVRCGSQAWLEFDHRQPVGKGGSSEPDNLRLLCRAHNLFAAERAYGRDQVERCIRREVEGTSRSP